MSDLLALDCPKCGAQLGKPLSGGEYLCAHCGEHSRPKVEVQIQRVVGPQQFNVIATQAEIDERRRVFELNAAKDQASRAERAQREAAISRSSRTVIIVIAIVLVITGFAVAAIMGIAIFSRS